ncbi:hypothetical protein ZMTM_07130 [Methyloradius palustris]|uniref:Diguanylate cyclase n=1 Tax=Methyloradius palustris TaxID=2778876 RepID=A0A8D5FYG2_9PROT|nr:hypothetical protein ZMTM_07130 [Methyloradius palustris]
MQHKQEILNNNFLNLKQSEQQYMKLLEDQTELISRLNADGSYIYVNEPFCRLFGVTREEMIGKVWHPIVWHEDVQIINEKLATLSRANPVVVIENRIVTVYGVRWAQFTNRGFFDRFGKLKEIQSVGRDINDQKLAEIKLQQLSSEQSIMLNNELVGIFKLQNKTIVWVNNAIPSLIGYEKKEIEGLGTRFLYPDDETYNKLGETAYPLLAAGKTYRSQQTLLKKNGERIWVDMHGASLPGNNNESLWIMIDLSALKKQREAIEAMAYHDVLTGLPNRLLLADRLEQALAHAKRNSKFVAVCYLDLDGFKPINDTYGHAAGDKLLAHIARCMQVATRSNDTVSRLGGDEFVILLTNLETIDEYKVVLDRVISAINQAVPIDADTEVFVTASIGISIYPSNSDNADSLLRFADEAMYVSKRSGRNCISLYQNTIN